MICRTLVLSKGLVPASNKVIRSIPRAPCSRPGRLIFARSSSTIADTAKQVVEDAKAQINKLGQAISGQTNAATEQAKDLQGDVQEKVEKTGEKISEGAETAKENVQAAPSDLKEKASKLGENIAEKADEAKKKVQEQANKAGDAIKGDT